jgi:hypothetical protein
MAGWEELQDYIAHSPKDKLEHFSQMARVNAKLTFTRRPDDDDFRVRMFRGVNITEEGLAHEVNKLEAQQKI